MGPARRRRGNGLSLVAGTQHRSRLGLDHHGTRHRKYELADRHDDSNEDGRKSADRGADGNDSERRPVRTVHIGVLDHLRLRALQAYTRTECPAGATPRNRAGPGTE